MTFSLTRPPSPIRETPISSQGHDEDHLSSALHAALSSIVPGSSIHPDHHHDMSKEKERVGIDIFVDSDSLFLKGTGVDVEPALLKGNIVLHLREPTSIKEITLQFRGKLRLPAQSAETLPLGSSQQWYSICNHEWSFLEGEKRHSHTLKAGSHQFPFQLQLGGSLPSTITTSVHSGAHVSYKLRAVAVRPGLAHNIQAVMPISIIRTFAPEALEYQQSLEIENTWPDKLMYSIMIPHKAWAAGDKLTAVVKFSPLSKGVRVLTVVTTINETTRLQYGKGGVQEHTRVVVTANYDILNGNAMPIAERHAGIRGISTSFPSTPALSGEDRSQSFGSLVGLVNQDFTLRQVPSRSSSSASESHSTLAPPLPSSTPTSSSTEPVALASVSTSMAEGDIPISQDDIVTRLMLFIPKSITPSHVLEPITVSHRIRWSILMSNLDGHTSELRCSLPLHILDARLLDEARANCAATRRLLLGSSEVPVDEEQDIELPSYSAHVRDRVANMYLPDSATTRVLNPWHHNSISPTSEQHHVVSGGACSPHGAASPLMPQSVLSHLPHVPQSGTSTPLEWVDSELLLSLSDTAPFRSRANTSPQPYSPSDLLSRPESRLVSRRGSRAPSPEHHFTFAMTTTATTPIPLSSSSWVTTSHDTFVHDGNNASRTLPGLFSIQMKPHSTSLTTTGWLSSRSNSHSNLTSLVAAAVVGDVSYGQQQPQQRTSTTTTQGYFALRQSSVTAPPVSASQAPMENVAESNTTTWHRALTEVPDYDVASRGFMGGVTPLTSMRGLPSYDEVERLASNHGYNHQGV